MTDGRPDGSRLCLACGLCCAGAIFGLVPLSPSEVPRMTRLGLPVYSPDDHPAMLQPCAALEGTACRIYTERPQRCASYRCHLFEAYQADEVGFDEALRVVTQVAALDGAEKQRFVDLHFLGRTSSWRPRGRST